MVTTSLSRRLHLQARGMGRKSAGRVRATGQLLAACGVRVCALGVAKARCKGKWAVEK